MYLAIALLSLLSDPSTGILLDDHSMRGLIRYTSCLPATLHNPSVSRVTQRARARSAGQSPREGEEGPWKSRGPPTPGGFVSCMDSGVV